VFSSFFLPFLFFKMRRSALLLVLVLALAVSVSAVKVSTASTQQQGAQEQERREGQRGSGKLFGAASVAHPV
jgi:hypothetical protein